MKWNRATRWKASLALVSLLGIALLFVPRQPSLKSLRNTAQILLASEIQRQDVASELTEQALPLMTQAGPMGSTAMLYYIGAAPICGADLSVVKIPPAKDLFEIQTVDLLLISKLLFRTRRIGPADQIVEVILGRKESRVESLQIAISIRLELGRDADVMRHTEEWVRLEPLNPQPYRVQSTVHRNHGRWDNFIISAENAVRLTKPVDWVLQVELADGYTQLGRTSDARREFDQIQEARPDLIPQAPIMHARLLLLEGQHQKSEEVIQKFLKSDPDDTEALLMLGKLQFARGQFDAAITTFERIQAVDPADEQAYYQLGQTHARAGRPELAAEYLEQHKKLLDAKVKLYGLEQQAAREPLNATVRELLAKSYAEIGLPEMAAFWSRAAKGVAAGP